MNESQQEVDEGGFLRARFANEGNVLSALDGEVDVFECRRGFIGIGVRNIFQSNVKGRRSDILVY